MANKSNLVSKLSSPLVLLLLAALLAGGVAWVAYLYLQQREEAFKQDLIAKNQKKTTPKVSVVVPKVDANVNTVLNSQTFVSRPVDEDLVYPDAVRSEDFPSLEGQKLARPVLRGRPLRLSDLQLPEVNDVASVVPAGQRAMTIDIDNLNSIAQTLRPNHRVDIFLMSRAPKPLHTSAQIDEKTLEQTTLFMQNMIILATGKEFLDVAAASERTSQMIRPGEVDGASQRDRGYDTVTLLVTPEQAARLLVGQKMGTYRVVLRGQNDVAALNLPPLRSGDLMPGMAQKREPRSIELIVGGRGENLVSKLPGSASTPASPAAARVTTEVNPPVAATVAAAAPISPANQPIPALRHAK